MKLLNQSVKYLSLSILLIVSIWSVVFYISMLDEIEDSIDDGLANYKLLVIQKAAGDSTVVTKSTFDESNYAIQGISPAVALAMKDRYVDTLMYMQDENDMEPVRMLTTAFQNNNRYYQLKVINSMVEEDDLIEDLFWSALWLYIILVVSIIIINNLVLQKLWTPFYSLLNQLQQFRLGKSKQLPQITTHTREFNDLKNAVNALLQHSVETYNQQKQFIENASHELQTPLAVATSKLELLLEKSNLSGTEAESISEVLQMLERMSQLNKSLLLLTKIENKQFFQNEPVNINTLARQCISNLEDFAAYKAVRIQLTEAAQTSIHINTSLASTVLLNLIKNAIIHNRAGGEVSIHITENALTICNTGAATPLDAAHIFQRFYKADAAAKGTGLGLAIIKAICNLYGFTIRYNYNNQQHCFTLLFAGSA